MITLVIVATVATDIKPNIHQDIFVISLSIISLTDCDKLIPVRYCVRGEPANNSKCLIWLIGRKYRLKPLSTKDEKSSV